MNKDTSPPKSTARAEKRGGEKSFGPLAPAGAEAILLGSYPSPLSFEQRFYYGHPRNRFWPLVARLAGRPAPTAVEEKKALIMGSRLALWDVLESCTITGASDASIENPVVNDIPALLAATGIKTVFCNGAAALRIYRSYMEVATGLPAVGLPSTSPANAAYSLDRLAGAWAPVAVYLRPPLR